MVYRMIHVEDIEAGRNEAGRGRKRKDGGRSVNKERRVIVTTPGRVSRATVGFCSDDSIDLIVSLD